MIPQTLNVWYIYLHFPYRFIVHVGKYATHWLFGFPLFTYCLFFGQVFNLPAFHVRAARLVEPGAKHVPGPVQGDPHAKPVAWSPWLDFSQVFFVVWDLKPWDDSFSKVGILGNYCVILRMFLGGGFIFFSLSPRKLGKMNPFWLIFFRWVETTNQLIFPCFFLFFVICV